MSTTSSDSSLSYLTDHLSLIHLNVQSTLPKFDIIKCESIAYDILVFTESWLKPDKPNEKLITDTFKSPFRKDRWDRPGGGVLIYTRDSIQSKRRTDLEMQDLEAVWVEITVKSKKILIGGFYRPPNSNTDYFNKINESTDRAYNTNIVDILIARGFIFNMFSNENNKIKEFIQQYNISQLIRESTYFTEHLSSLVDLILVRNTTNIVTSGVANSFIPDQIRCHCPVLVLLKFLRPPVKSYKRRVWNHPLADFNKYREQLTNFYLQNKLESNSNIDNNVLCLANCIMKQVKNLYPTK